jgi:DNA-binding transcriptional LysR family regulator
MLTPAGQQLLSKARVLLAHAEEFQTTAGALNSELSGRIRMACFVNLAPMYFASLLANFMRSYPDVEVEFYDRDQAEIFDGIRDARYELALTFDLGELDEFEVISVAKIPPHAILEKNHRLAGQTAVSLKELSPEPLILMDLPHSREYLLSLFSMLNLRPNLKYLPRSFEMVRALAGNGLGYGLLGLVPRSSLAYDGSTVISLPLKEPLRDLNIVVVQLKKMPMRHVAKTFIQFTKEYFSNLDS